MRLRLVGFAFLFGAAVAAAEPGQPIAAHDEMASALEAQLDLEPAPARLPTAMTPRLPVTPRTATTNNGNGNAQHGPGNGQGQGQAQAILHHAEAAANSAVGQERAEDAKNRAKMHPHGH
jgi:hypothetical protein